jgi:MOSC domain-containing protein YiiM
MTAGSLQAIWIKRVRRGPMDSVTHAALRAGRGIVGNADQGGRRQIILMDRRAWDEVIQELGDYVDPVERRANLLVGGLSLTASRGKILRVGGCRLRINGEARPCHLMDDARPGLRRALEPAWRGGVYAEVLDDGQIELGAPVEWTDSKE